MQTFGCAALDAHANAGDAHFEVRGRQPDDADSSGVSREGGARSDVGSKDVPLSAHSTEEDADDTPSWTNSWVSRTGEREQGRELAGEGGKERQGKAWCGGKVGAHASAWMSARVRSLTLLVPSRGPLGRAPTTRIRGKNCTW